MRYPFIAFIGFSLFTLLIDFFLVKYLKNTYPDSKNPKLSFPVCEYWHYLCSLVFIISFLVSWIMVKNATSPEVYQYFMWLLMTYLLIYAPKFFYLLFITFSSLVIVIKDKFFTKGKNKKMNDGRYPRISRKKFLSQAGIVFASAPFISLLFGALKGRFAFDIIRTRIPFSNLPESFNGLKIIQISDLHLGSFNSNHKEIEKVVEMINNEKPDIICFTGDLVNNFHEETIGWDTIFKQLKAPLGKYSILGNHDYGDYSTWKYEAEKIANFEGIKDAHDRFGFNLLTNESVILTKNGDNIAIAGVENWGLPPFPQYGNLAKASKGIENIPFRILLSHDPDHWDAEVRKNGMYSLTLSGHTHGMQLGFKYKNFQWSPAKYKFRRWAGLYHVGKQYLYVNRGLGYLGMPARVGMPPEITVIELYSV
ncbi:MAG: metallophosphoesterase [Chlorobi bacterium]|nr:metallophosphoesterase [Chlorobiota bacterium]